MSGGHFPQPDTHIPITRVPTPVSLSLKLPFIFSKLFQDFHILVNACLKVWFK